MTKLTPTDILETLFKKVSGKKRKKSFVKNDLASKIGYICRCNSNKAPIRFLMSCLLAEIHQPNIDIRKPYKEIEGDGTYSGRSYDEKFVELAVHKYGLPCNPTTAFLTPAFRNLDRILVPDLAMVGRPKQVYQYTLEILTNVYNKDEKSENILKEIIRVLFVIKLEDEQRMSQLISNLKQSKDALPLSTEEIVTLLKQHLNCKGSSRLPVLIIASAYRAVKEKLGEINKVLEAHNAADKQTGSIGDIEITLVNDDRIITSYEMKDKRITKIDIEVALKKLANSNSNIDNYIFITTDIIDIEVKEYARSCYDATGIEFSILDCIGFIRHFLHFFHRQRGDFIEFYQEMVINEQTSAVSQPLKEAFLALRRAAETDRR